MHVLFQLQAREASLQAENENYAKALAARQQHAREKAQETLQLAATLEVFTFISLNVSIYFSLGNARVFRQRLNRLAISRTVFDTKSIKDFQIQISLS